MFMSESDMIPGKLRITSQTYNNNISINDVNAGDKNNKFTLKEIVDKEKHDKAYKEGWDVRHEQAEQEKNELNQQIGVLEQKIEELNEILESVSKEIPNALSTYLQELEDQIKAEICDVSFKIAEVLLNREITIDSNVTGVINDSLSKITKFKDVKIFLSHEDFMHLRKTRDEELSPEIEIVSEPSLEKGDVKIECEQEIIDARLSTRMQTLSDLIREKHNHHYVHPLCDPKAPVKLDFL